MPLFYYTARSQDGVLLRGSIEGVSTPVVLTTLRTRSLIVTSLQRADSARGALTGVFHGGPLDRKSLTAFFRSFATLIQCGVGMRRALEVTIAQTPNARLAEALRAVVNDIESGMSLSAAMERRPREFPALFVAMIRAGEIGGALDEVLERLAGLLEHESAVRKRLYTALAYPAVIMLAAGGVVTFLVGTVVPTFATMYEQMRVPVPAVTQLLIEAGWVLRSPLTWLSLCCLGAACFVAAVRIRRRRNEMRLFDAARLHVPVFGAIVRKATIARFARTAGTLLKSGVAIIASLEIAAGVVENVIYRENVENVAAALRNGVPFSEPIHQSGLYEPMFVQLLRVGEETGSLDAMLIRIAEYYELDVETALAALGSVLEPLMIMLLGGAVAFIVAAIFVPLYTLIGSIK